MPCENCNGEGCEICKMQKLLARAYQLVNRSMNMISHGKPTIEEGQQFMKDVEEAMPNLLEVILETHTF